MTARTKDSSPRSASAAAPASDRRRHGSAATEKDRFPLIQINAFPGRRPTVVRRSAGGDTRILAMGRERGLQEMPNEPGGSEPLRLLLLQDDPVLAIELEVFLRDLGAEVVASGSAIDAVLRIAMATPVDAALLDIKLGPGLGGIELARQLRTLGIAIIFITGFVSALEDVAEMGGVHPYAWFGKPYQPEALARTLERLASERGKRLDGRGCGAPPAQPD
jgi:CheY-like chemotaxis protein